MSNRLVEPGSKEPGPRIGIVGTIDYYILQQRKGKTRKTVGGAFDKKNGKLVDKIRKANAGVFIVKPGARCPI